MNELTAKPIPRRNFFFLLIPFILFALVIISFNLNKPFNLDEADFAKAAHRLNADPHFLSENPQDGLWHPPLYIHSLAAVFQLFGESTGVARGLGFLFYILTVIFVILTCKELFEPEEYPVISVIAAVFFLINPLSIQFALQLDIDGGLLTWLMTVFCYFFVRFNKRGMTVAHGVILGVLFGVSMLAKFTTPPVIIPAVFLFYILGRNYKKAFLQTFLILAVGIVSFSLIWYGYCAIFNVEFLYPFKYTFGSKLGQGGFAINRQKIELIQGSLKYFLYWVSPAFVMLMALTLMERVRSFLKKRDVEDVDFLMILGAGIFLFYFYFFPRQSMMKYQAPLYPIFAIMIAHSFYNIVIKDKKVNIVEAIVIGACAIVTLAYYLCNFPDMVLWLRQGEGAVSIFFQNNYNLFLKLYFLPFFCIPILFRSTLKKKSFYFCLTAALLLLAVDSQIVQNIRQTAEYTTANSWHNYGEKGQAQAAEYLNEKLSPNGVFISRKDVSYYVRDGSGGSPDRKYIYNKIFRLPKAKAQAEMEELVKEHDIQYIQLDIYSNPRNGFEVLSADYVLDKRFDDFFILKKK